MTLPCHPLPGPATRLDSFHSWGRRGSSNGCGAGCDPGTGVEEEGALGEEWAEAIAGVVASGFAAAAASLGGATAAPPAGFGVTESVADAGVTAEEEEVSGAAAAKSGT